MERNPQRIKPITAEWVERAQALVAGVDISDIDEPLPEEEE